MAETEERFIVRLWDMFDGWIDVTEPLSKADADAVWNRKTNNGTAHTCYEDGDYYAVYPADTRMLYRPETLRR